MLLSTSNKPFSYCTVTWQMIPKLSGLWQSVFVLTLRELQVSCDLADPVCISAGLICFSMKMQLSMALGSGLGSDLFHELLFWGLAPRASRCLWHTFLMVGRWCAKAKSNYTNTYEASTCSTFANTLLAELVTQSRPHHIRGKVDCLN